MEWMMTVLKSAAVVALLWGGSALGQIIDHVGRLEGAPDFEEKGAWKGLIKQEDPHRWVVEFRVRGFIAPRGSSDAEVSKHAEKGVRVGVFCLPWVDRSATQRGDERSLTLEANINGAPVSGRLGWLDAPKGME